ncbi:MAG: hypothetical protein JO127_11060 [Caulobacteraceae bacterium]|nr:hypothetical protein [Caulobacteraceae bacterium]
MSAENAARQLWMRLGSEAAPAVALCLEDCKRLGLGWALRFWTDVARRLQAIGRDQEGSPGGREVDPAASSRIWLCMQRVERYRHRALQAENLAARSPAQRAELLEVAAEWLDLAKQAERVARQAETVGEAHRHAARLREKAKA